VSLGEVFESFDTLLSFILFHLSHAGFLRQVLSVVFVLFQSAFDAV